MAPTGSKWLLVAITTLGLISASDPSLNTLERDIVQRSHRNAFLFPDGEECIADAHRLCSATLEECVGEYQCTLKCLTDHMPKLSGGCLEAHPCYDDFNRHCLGLEPGDNALIKCLNARKTVLSKTCKESHPCFENGRCSLVDYKALEQAAGPIDSHQYIPNRRLRKRPDFVMASAISEVEPDWEYSGPLIVPIEQADLEAQIRESMGLGIEVGEETTLASAGHTQGASLLNLGLILLLNIL